MRRRTFIATGACTLGGGCLRLTEDSSIEDGDESARGPAGSGGEATDETGFMDRGNAANTGLTDSGTIPDAVEDAWRIEVTPSGTHIATPAVVDGYVYLSAGNGRVVCVSIDDQEIAWSFQRDADAPRQTPAVTGDRVYVYDGDKQVYALDAASGDEAWRFEARRDVNSEITVAGGRVYFGGDDDKLYVLEAASGEELWTSRGLYYTGVAVRDGNVVAQEGLTLEVRDAVSGDVQWETRLDHRGSGACLASGVVYLAGGGSPTAAYAFDVETGDERWRTDLTAGRNGMPTLSETALVAPAKGGLVAFDRESGAELWRYDHGPEMGGVSPLRAGSELYFLAEETTHPTPMLFALDAATGNRRELLEVSHPGFRYPVFRDGRVFAASFDGFLNVLATT